mgnify:FL=1
MKKNFKFYAVSWALLFAIFNVLAFAVGFKNNASFWTAYITSVIAMLLQLVCAKISFKPEKLDRLFLNIPVISITFTGMVASMIIGAVCMVIPSVPVVAIIVIEYLILAFTGISVLKANAAAEIVNEVGEKVKEKTQFIKLTTVDAQNLMNSAKSESVKSACKKVYDALRYSDPMSSEALSGIESQITNKFDSFSQAVYDDDYELAEANADELLNLINNRNAKCKALK